MIDVSDYWPDLDFPVLRDMKKAQPVFLRFGRWGGASLNWSDYSKERGVSVYPAEIIDGVVCLSPDWGDDVEYACRVNGSYDGRTVWVLTGKVVGKGSDGEPVLQGVVARKLPIDINLIPNRTELRATHLGKEG